VPPPPKKKVANAAAVAEHGVGGGAAAGVSNAGEMGGGGGGGGASELRPGMEGYDERASLRGRIVDLQERLDKATEQLTHEKRRSKVRP